MNWARIFIGAWVGLLLFGIGACGPNQGVEVGNPKVGGKVVTLQPEDSDITYIIQFTSDSRAQVTQIIENNFDTVTAEIDIDNVNYIVQVVADFDDGTHFEAEISVDDESGNILSVQLKLDGKPTPIHVNSQPGKPSSKPLATNGAEQVVASLCDRVAECQPETVATECETAVRDLPGLSQEFGNAQDQSLMETAEALRHGNSQADPDALTLCLEAMALLPCEQVDKGHSRADPSVYNYKKVKSLIPRPICSKVFAGSH